MSLLGIATAIGSQVSNHGAERRNYRNERNLMGLQQQNQMGLNQQGHDLQMDMWNKTNYGAQMEHIKNAGLNPALMYGMSGGGGTTAGSQGGGSASKGSSQQGRQMDMSNLLVGAQAEKLKEETKDIVSARTKRDGPDTNAVNTGIDKVNQEIANLIKSGKVIEADFDLKVTQNEQAQIDRDIKQGNLDFYTTNGLAQDEYALLKGFKSLGVDVVEGLEWLNSGASGKKDEIFKKLNLMGAEGEKMLKALMRKFEGDN